MPWNPCRTYGWAVLALTTAALAACTGEQTSRPRVDGGETSVLPAASASASLQVLPVPDTGRVIEHLADRTGPWKATVGAPDDTGPVDISVTCLGGGLLTFAYRDTASTDTAATGRCDGSTMHNRDESAKPGTVTVTIEPDGDQRWSLLLVRGMQLG